MSEKIELKRKSLKEMVEQLIFDVSLLKVQLKILEKQVNEE